MTPEISQVILKSVLNGQSHRLEDKPTDYQGCISLCQIDLQWSLVLSTKTMKLNSRPVNTQQGSRCSLINSSFLQQKSVSWWLWTAMLGCDYGSLGLTSPAQKSRKFSATSRASWSHLHHESTGPLYSSNWACMKRTATHGIYYKMTRWSTRCLNDTWALHQGCCTQWCPAQNNLEFIPVIRQDLFCVQYKRSGRILTSVVVPLSWQSWSSILECAAQL